MRLQPVTSSSGASKVRLPVSAGHLWTLLLHTVAYGRHQPLTALHTYRHKVLHPKVHFLWPALAYAVCEVRNDAMPLLYTV